MVCLDFYLSSLCIQFKQQQKKKKRIDFPRPDLNVWKEFCLYVHRMRGAGNSKVGLYKNNNNNNYGNGRNGKLWPNEKWYVHTSTYSHSLTHTKVFSNEDRLMYLLSCWLDLTLLLYSKLIILSCLYSTRRLHVLCLYSMQHLDCMSTSAYFVRTRVGQHTNAMEHSQGKC